MSIYIHQTWKTHTVPEKWKQSQRQWEQFATEHNSFEYKLWSDDDNRELIATDYAWFHS
jgi:mannosyltransferase OCH1-like enzyme